MAGDAVRGLPPGARDQGAMVRAADVVLGWTVLDGRGVA
jgi:hypothetical protein